MALMNNSFIRFILVGAANTLAGLSISYVMYHFWTHQYWVSTFCGNTAGAALSFVLNRRFTFRSEADVGSSLLKFVSVILACYFISYWAGLQLASLLAPLFGPDHADRTHNAAILLGNGIYTLTGYAGHRFFTFREYKGDRYEKEII
jgi:putative flippase GtrA